MNTEFGDKLQSAINSIDSYTWKDKNGNVVKLMDASEQNLKQWYTHCYEMLYNKDIYSPGKYNVRENIYRIWDSCNTELFVRYLLYECNTNIKTKKDILDLINLHRGNADHDILNESISTLFSGLDSIYEKITISKLMDACFDKLDILNRKMINDKFILSQGIWLTDDEKVELTEISPDGKKRNMIEVLKERLCLDPNLRLRISPRGLSYSEFRSLVQLSPFPKISTLPSTTLRTLRDKVLLLLDNNLTWHINKWHTLMNNIKKVCSVRDIELPYFGELK